MNVYFDECTQILARLGDEYSTQERFSRQHYNALRAELNRPFLDPAQPDRKYPLGPAAIRSNLLNIYDRLIKQDPVSVIDLLLQRALLYSPLLLIQITHP